MKVPLSWLRDYVEITLPVAELAERLSLSGLEVAGIRPVGHPIPEGVRVKPEDAGPVWEPDKVIIAQIVEVQKHPDADKLKLPLVDFGAGKTKQLLTGAPNIAVGDKGQKVVVGLENTTYFDGHAKDKKKELKKLKPAKVRGILSDAMVMSEFELGMSEEHEGVIILDDDAPIGTPFVEYMGDYVLDIDILPNMARCLSMIGIAREVAALTGQRIKLPPHVDQAAGPDVAGLVNVVIEDPKLSARYAATLLKNVTVGPSPYWLRRRLALAGMRPINNLVDVTNYVMLEWGQPLHAFDHDRLVDRAGGKTPTVIVRPAKSGEKLITLDKNERTLSPDNLVIADTRGPIALAGVMGGLETEVVSTTKNVLLESASFDFVSIRKTYRQFDLPSEASARFSRGVPSSLVEPAAQRAAELMRQYGSAIVCKGMVDVHPAPRLPQVVELKLAEIKRQLGAAIPKADVQRILGALEFEVAEAGSETLKVTVPPHRLDIQAGAADLIEDLARIHGYDRLPATLLAEPLPEQAGNRRLDLEERTRDLLVNAGLQEVITYALTSPEREAPLGADRGEYVRLQNPIHSERCVMRHSLLASVLEAAATNLKHTDQVRLFEIGYVYNRAADQPLPQEQLRLAIVMSGPRQGAFWADSQAKAEPLDFFDLKGVVEALAGELHLQHCWFGPTQVPYLHPGRTAGIDLSSRRCGDLSGVLGQLHPRTAQAYAKLWDAERLGKQDVLVADIDLEALLGAVPERHVSRPLSSFPPALRDVAVIVDKSVTAEQVEQQIRAAGEDLLQRVWLFDVYQGDRIPAGKKSLAYALTYQAFDRTLADKDIEKAHKKVEDRLKHVLKATIRGKE